MIDCPECGRANTAETGVAISKDYGREMDRTYLSCDECGEAIGFQPGDTR